MLSTCAVCSARSVPSKRVEVHRPRQFGTTLMPLLRSSAGIGSTVKEIQREFERVLFGLDGACRTDNVKVERLTNVWKSCGSANVKGGVVGRCVYFILQVVYLRTRPQPSETSTTEVQPR